MSSSGARVAPGRMVNPVWGVWIDRINNDILHAIENDKVELEAIINRARKGLSFLLDSNMSVNKMSVKGMVSYLGDNNMPGKEVYANDFCSNPLMPLVYDLQSDTVAKRRASPQCDNLDSRLCIR